MAQIPEAQASPRIVMDALEISRTLTRIAHQILEANKGIEDLLLLGIPTRGVPLAERIADLIETAEGVRPPVGTLDITMYRDDLRDQPTRAVGKTELPSQLSGKTVFLIDDVLYSGRTVVAALDAIKDLGRPAKVRLAVLVDRGHREVPIRPDVVGKDMITASDEHVKVRLTELDDVDQVTISREEK